MPTSPEPVDGVDAPRVLSFRTVHDGWARYGVARLVLADGTEVAREVEDHGDAVAILPFDPARRIALLVRQVRAPALHAAGTPAVREVPAGGMEPGEDPLACAGRELFEEVGLRGTALEPAGIVWSMPGISTERLHLFLAPFRPEQREGAGGGVADEHEGITIEEVTLADLAAAADAGILDDMKTLALVQTLRLRRPDLFA